MQDGGGGALRGAAAPAGSCASRLRDAGPDAPVCEWEGSAEPAARPQRGAARGPAGGGQPQGRDSGLSPPEAAGGGASEGEGPGLPCGWGAAAEGQTHSSFALGISAARKELGGGGAGKEKSQPLPWERSEQLGVVEESGDWVRLLEDAGSFAGPGVGVSGVLPSGTCGHLVGTQLP